MGVPSQLGLNGAVPELKHFEGIDASIQRALKDKEAKARAKTVLKPSARPVIKKETIGQLQDNRSTSYGAGTQKVKLEAPATPLANSFVTPAKRGMCHAVPACVLVCVLCKFERCCWTCT